MADKGLLLYVIGCATVSICICEAVSWLLVFRLEDFQRLHAQYASASKRLARKQEELATVAVDKKIDKKDKKLIIDAAPFEARLATVIPEASPSGAATMVGPLKTRAKAEAVEVIPRSAKCPRSRSRARSTRIRAAFSFSPNRAPTSTNGRFSK
jgi:hypothetical protein